MKTLLQWLENVKEDGSNPIRGGLMPVTCGLEYTVTTDGPGAYTLTRVTRNGRDLDEDAVYSVLMLGDLNFIEASYYCNCPMPQNLLDKLTPEKQLGYEVLVSALNGGHQLEKPSDYVTIRSR